MKVQVFLLIALLAIVTQAAVTDPGRTDVSNKKATQVLNKEFKLEYFAKANWFNAWLSCLSCGMKLASVTSREEQDAVFKLIGEYGLINNRIWIAGNDLATEGRFNWFMSGEIFRYTNWRAGEPNNLNGTEHCVEIRVDGQTWNDQECTDENFFLCEKSFECS